MPTPINQLLSRTLYATDGTTTVWDFAFSGGYLLPGHVKAYVETPEGAQTPVTGILTGPYQLTIAPVLVAGNTLVIYRDTPKDLPLVDFTDESGFSEIALDTNAKQAVFIAAEVVDVVNTSTTYEAEQAAISAAGSALAAAASAVAASLAAATASADAADAAASAASINPANFATSVQGGKADTALQPTNIGVSVQGYAADIATVSATQGEMEAGVLATVRSMSPLHIAQAIAALSDAGPIVSLVPVRQTVLSGPVDTNGFAAFGGTTGSTTVTATGTIRPTAANGYDASGAVDYVGSITNPSWTGLTASAYLYLDIAPGGACTTGSTTLQPAYQSGGTYSTTNGQFTFNIQEMTGKVGNGATATQTYRVFVGEVTASGTVSAITWYALRGRYVGAFINTLPTASTLVSVNHNLGNQDFDTAIEIKCLTAEYNYSIGDIVEQFVNWRAGAGHQGFNFRKRALTVSTTTADGAWQGQNATTNTGVLWTAANWAYRFTAKRRW